MCLELEENVDVNILMLAPLPPPSGGIASWTVRYRDYCRKNNIGLEIVNIAQRGKRVAKETTKKNIITEVRRTIDIISNLKKALKKKLPNVVHINTSGSPLGVLRDALCAFVVHDRVPIVLHFHCNIEDQLGKNNLSKNALKYLVQKSKKVIVLNKFSHRYIDKIAQDKAVFVPNFVDEKMINDNHIINDTIKRVIFVGHIEKAKGIRQIIDAARNHPDIVFDLLGAVREDLSSYRFTSNVNIVGRVSIDKVHEYLEQADLFVFPSLSEGFSYALLEAMAGGLPIIASDVGANSEMIEDEGGIVLQENTGEELSKAIDRLKESEIRRNMSKWNIEKVRNNYTVNIVMNQYFNTYKDVQMNRRMYVRHYNDISNR